MDSGAANHICNSLDCFENHHLIKPIPVHLPNGHVVLAKIARDVRVTNLLTLKDTLLLLEFNLNIISISKLTKSAKYSFNFVDDLCYI